MTEYHQAQWQPENANERHIRVHSACHPAGALVVQSEPEERVGHRASVGLSRGVKGRVHFPALASSGPTCSSASTTMASAASASRTTTILTVLGVTALTGALAYVVWFDHRRKYDKEFRKKLST